MFIHPKLWSVVVFCELVSCLLLLRNLQGSGNSLERNIYSQHVMLTNLISRFSFISFFFQLAVGRISLFEASAASKTNLDEPRGAWSLTCEAWSMLSETVLVRHGNEATKYSRCKMAASASWVQGLKSRTISTARPRSAEEEREVPGRIMSIF